MSELSSKTVLMILKQYGREEHVEPSPRPSHLRIHHMNNDVSCAIDLMGGIQAAAVTLGVKIDELNKWIDEHFAPESFASAISKHTGYSVWSIQQPTFYVFDGSNFWPHLPSMEELKHRIRISIYRRKLPQYPNRVVI